MSTLPITLPDIRVLRQFVAVAEFQSLRRAAESLHMSQPPLTVAMRQLETQLGAELFTRSPAGITLTPAGEVLHREAKQLLAQARRAVELTQATARGDLGEVRIAFITSAMMSFLPAVLSSFSEQFPQVRLKLTEGVSVDVAHLVATGEIDVGFLSPPVPVETAPALISRPMVKDRLVAVLPSGHRLAGKRSIALSALAKERFICFSADKVPAFHHRIVGACVEAGFQPTIVQEAAHIPTIVSLVAGKMGVALVPGSVAKGNRGVVQVPIKGSSKLLDTQIDVVTRGDVASSAVANFMRHCHACARSD